MRQLSVGDRVRVDIPDETDSNHLRFHGKHGVVIALVSDDADSVSRSERGGDLFRVEFDDGGYADFRDWELRPPITE